MKGGDANGSGPRWNRPHNVGVRPVSTVPQIERGHLAESETKHEDACTLAGWYPYGYAVASRNILGIGISGV